MPTATNRTAPITYTFADDGTIPTIRRCRSSSTAAASILTGSPDPEKLIEQTFAANGWGEMWRNGVYPYVHYHSMIHEAMGVARGRAKVRFGGEKGREIDVVPGDVVILPAGTGHQMPDAEPGPRGYRRLSAERQIRSLPRQQGRACQGARLDPESAATRHRSGVRSRRAADRAVVRMISDWLAFWDSSHSIYVNARHKDVHYRLIAQEIAALVPSGKRACSITAAARRCTPISSRRRPASYCCAMERPAYAPASARVLSGIRKSASSRRRTSSVCRTRSLDLIVLHSVAQYLTLEQSRTLLELFHRLLQAGGVLLVSDVIPPHVAASTDAAALLRFAAANGFLIAAFLGLARTLISDYWRLRTRIGLTRYGEAAMIEKLAAAGFHGAPLGKEHRTQSGAHGVHGAAGKPASDAKLTGLPSAANLV